MLSRFKKEVNLVERLIKFSLQSQENKNKYSIGLHVKGLFLNHPEYSLIKYKNGKKINGYGILDLIYNKYTTDERFKLVDASQDSVLHQLILKQP